MTAVVDRGDEQPAQRRAAGRRARSGRAARRGHSPTMADVASAAGVSVTTVSFVLNDRPGTGLREETRQRVREAIAQLGYRPNQQARSLALSRSRTIGYVGEQLGTPFAGRIISGAHQRATDHDSVLLILDAEDEQELAETVMELLSRRVDGILVATDGTRTVTLPPVISRTPAILVNCLVDGLRAPSLLPDEQGGARAATRLLLEAGHSEIAYLAGDSHAWATRHRVRGFRSEVKDAGLDPRRMPVLFGDYRADSGYELCLQVMKRRHPPTALFFGNDRMALGGYFALADLGLRVPDDVSVVGYDDQEELADSVRPGLSTVRLPFYELGWAAVRHLMDDTLGTLPARSTIACPLVERGSVAPPAGAGRVTRPRVPPT